jgi:hypothetical protein
VSLAADRGVYFRDAVAETWGDMSEQ